MIYKNILKLLPLLLSVALCGATAAPVVYSFNFTNSAAQKGSGLSGDSVSFTFVAPGYLTAVDSLNSKLTSSFITPPDSLGPVSMNQVTDSLHTYVDVGVTGMEADDFNQPATSVFLLGLPPGQGNVYLDLDGSYTFSGANVLFEGANYLGGGTVRFSVAAAPEPSAFSLLLIAAPVAWKFRRRRLA